MKAFGKTQDYLILKTVINEMTLSIPVDQISTVGVRPPVSSSELQDLVSVLAKADPRVPANWSRRFAIRLYRRQKKQCMTVLVSI